MMATENQNFAHRFTDTYPPSIAPEKKRRQTPYKPRISTVVKLALEDSMKETRHAQSYLEEMLGWLAAERQRREELRARISTLAPLDHRMQKLVEEEKESLLSIGKLDHMVAGLSQSMMRLERHLSETLDRTVEAVAPPRERKSKEQ